MGFLFSFEICFLLPVLRLQLLYFDQLVEEREANQISDKYVKR